MTSHTRFPPLAGWEATRKTLHAYTKVAGAPPRVLADPHPKWWHVSMKVSEQGLLSDVMTDAELGGQEVRTLLNLQSHTLDLLVDGETNQRFDLTAGDTATELGARLEAAFADLGVVIELPEDRYADDNPREYDPEAAGRYLVAVNAVNGVMKALRGELDGERSPVQLWPHHFDLAFEWFGTKTMKYEEDGEEQEYPAQLNFGFAPGDSSYADPYFYSNPWPFERTLTEESLPHGARWFTDGFEGTLLPYQQLAGEEDAAGKLLAYYRRVFELAKPTLME